LGENIFSLFLHQEFDVKNARLWISFAFICLLLPQSCDV